MAPRARSSSFRLMSKNISQSAMVPLVGCREARPQSNNARSAMPDLEGLPLVTTVAGSYPVDGLPPRRAIQRAVEDQLVAGIDVISDGQARGDMISVFARAIPGLRQAHDGVWEVESALDLP